MMSKPYSLSDPCRELAVSEFQEVRTKFWESLPGRVWEDVEDFEG